MTVEVKMEANGMRYSGPVLTSWPGPRRCAWSWLRSVRWYGTNARSTTMSSLAVPRSPMTSQTSSMT